MTIETLHHRESTRHPQLLVTTLLQHCLDAATHALAAAHPEIGECGSVRELDEDAFVAHIVVRQLSEIGYILDRYRALTEGAWAREGQLDINF